MMKKLVFTLALLTSAGLPAVAAARGGQAPVVQAPTDVKPVSI